MAQRQDGNIHHLYSNKVNDPAYVAFYIVILGQHEVIYIWYITRVEIVWYRTLNVKGQMFTSRASLASYAGYVSGRYIAAIVDVQSLAPTSPEFAGKQGMLCDLFEAHKVPQVDVDASLDEVGDGTTKWRSMWQVTKDLREEILLIENVRVEPVCFDLTSHQLFLCALNPTQSLQHLSSRRLCPWLFADLTAAVLQQCELVDEAVMRNRLPVNGGLRWVEGDGGGVVGLDCIADSLRASV